MATIVDDSNSNLLWSGNSWNTEHSDDPLTGRYFNSTFHASTISGEYCIIAWNGTDIYVYGARRKNHGLYGIIIDGGEIQYFSGFSQDGQFQATLFATNGLKDGSHTLKIINENQRNQEQYPDYVYLDIDSVAVNGVLINAASNTTSASSSSLTPTSSSSSWTLSESSDISSGQYSNTVSSAIIVSTASENPNTSNTLKTSVSSFIPSNPVTSTSISENRNSSNDRKIITLAISIPVIVISSIVIFIFIVVYFWKRRQKKYEKQTPRQYNNYYNGYMDEQLSS